MSSAAVDIAKHGAAGKIARQPVHALVRVKVHSTLELCSATGVDETVAMAAHAASSAACHAYKIKAPGNIAHETAAVPAVAVANSKPLWLDAGQSCQPSGVVPAGTASALDKAVFAACAAGLPTPPR